MRLIAVLAYHSLDDSGSVVSVGPRVFEAHMAGLAEAGWQVVSLRQALAQREKSGDWPQNAAVLTFDDGFASVHEHALPVLARYGFGGTVFVVAGHVEGRNDWGRPPPELGYRATLSWDQLIDLSNRGVEIGAHTLSHADLSKLDRGPAEREILGSVGIISRRLGKPVETFAYPYGIVTPQAAAIAGRTFRAACTTEHRRASDEPLALLPRIEMYYLRHRLDLCPLVGGQLDRAVTLRRWVRRVRRLGIKSAHSSTVSVR